MNYDIDLTELFKIHPWLEVIFGPLTEIFGTQLQFSWACLITIVGFYCVVYAIYGRGKNFWRFSFPKEVYLHRSSKLDFATFVIYTPMAMLGIWVATPYLSNANSLSDTVFQYFNQNNYTYYTLEHPLIMALVVFVGVAWADLSQFITHVAYHRIPWLWEFHKIHHSAEVLTVEIL